MLSLARSMTSFSKQEIKHLFKTAQTKFKENSLEIKITPKIHDFGRILIVIPKRSGNAVKRNRARRRIKNIFYQERLYEHGKDCIVFVGRQAIDLSYDHLKKLLLQVFETH